MTDQEIQQKYSLKKLPHDGRDFLYGSIFGKLPTPKDLPDQFLVSDKDFIKNQWSTDYCSCFAGTEVSEDEEGVELDPLWQFMKSKIIEGDPNGFGCDLRSMALSFIGTRGIKGGSIEQKYSPYTTGTQRSLIVNPQAWTDKDYDSLAAAHVKKGFAFVSGAYDFFDNIRATIYHTNQQYNVKQSAVVGFDWCLEYNVAKGGIVSTAGKSIVGGHAIKIKGWMQIEGEPYLVAQLAQGKDFGANGYMFFSRDVVNAQSDYGAVVFLPVDKNKIQDHVEAGAKLDDSQIASWVAIMINKLISIFKSNG